MPNLATPLCKIAYRYACDKCPQIKHSYTPFYYEIFKDRPSSVKKVVEIGVQFGRSLFTWRDFFPNAQIYGADINIDYVFDFNTERIKTFLCDQAKESDLKKLLSETGVDIDLFIDDGSHKPDDQIFTCKTVLPLLDQRAIYVIEDVKNRGIVNSLGMFNCELKRRAKKTYSDDRMLIVTNK
jgi:hypothetical protein